jgi:hypothetical protein
MFPDSSIERTCDKTELAFGLRRFRKGPLQMEFSFKEILSVGVQYIKPPNRPLPTGKAELKSVAAEVYHAYRDPSYWPLTKRASDRKEKMKPGRSMIINGILDDVHVYHQQPST